MPEDADLYHYLITGANTAKDEDGHVHPRLEINDLREKDIQFSLFIRALNTVFDRKTEYGVLPSYLQRPDSWWQIGGIHGLPNEPWSGDPDGLQKAASGDYGGYCYHGSALFPPWHRVLLLLVEQVIVKEAKDFVSKLPEGFPEEEDWKKAAEELRLPYWDWTSKAASKRGLPEVFRWPKIFIVSPTSAADDEVPNPLNHYRFPENHKLLSKDPALAGMGHWSRTYRWVNFECDPPKEEYKQLREAFRKGGGPQGFKNERVTSLRKKVAALFKYPVKLQPGDEKYGPNLWGHFATTSSEDIHLPKERYHSLPSIEDPHNKVHLDIGGFGTMAFNEFAGFDPIFYLHHCNIDRIYAFWEWLYPDYWIGEDGWVGEDGKRHPFTNAKEGNFGQDRTGTLSASTDLLPFRITKDTYWTSEDARGLLKGNGTQKYYTYPAITDKITGGMIQPHIKLSGDPETFRQALYNEWGTDLATDVRDVRQALVGHGSNWPDDIKKLLLHEPDGKDNAYLRNYVIVGEVPEFAFPGSYRLELYLRQDGNNPLHVIDDISVFGRIDPDRCASCVDRRSGESQVRGHMLLEPLTILFLIERGDPGSKPADKSALDWLYEQIKDKFRLRFVKPYGGEIADTETTDNDKREPLEVDKIPRLTLHWHTVWFRKSDLTAQQTEQMQAIDLGVKDDAKQEQGRNQDQNQGTLNLTGDFNLGGAWKKCQAQDAPKQEQASVW